MKIIKPFYTIEDEINGSEILKKIEKAGRTCYKSEDKITDDSAEKFIRRILKSGHESVIEHEKITVRIICDRGISHEIVRHRIASYSQESTRYCNYSGQVIFIRPLWVEDIDLGEYTDWEIFLAYKNNPSRIWLHCCLDAEKHYMQLIKLGWSPEQARSVLPNSLKTEIVCTFNIREWRHFFKLRTAKAAHPQMREITIPMLKEFKEKIPVIFEDIIIEE